MASPLDMYADPDLSLDDEETGDDMTSASASGSEPSAVPGRSPGGYKHDPYRRAPAPAQAMSTFDVNNATRAQHAAERTARQTDQEDIQNRRRDHLQATTGQAVDPHLDIGAVRLDQQTADLMSQNPKTQAAAEAETYRKNGWTGETATQRQQAGAEQEQSQHDAYDAAEHERELAQATGRVAMDPASQAGSGSKYDPYRSRSASERSAAIAAQFPAGSPDSVTVSDGGTSSTSTRSKDGVTDTASSPAQPPRQAMVKNDAGEWVPMDQETQSLANANKSAGDIYARKQYQGELQAAETNLSPQLKAGIRRDVYREMGIDQNGTGSAAVNDPYRRRNPNGVGPM